MVFNNDDPHPFSQKELNDLVRDLSFSKSSAELLASKLKENKTYSLTVLASFYTAKGILRFFFFEEEDSVYYTDIAKLLRKIVVP